MKGEKRIKDGYVKKETLLVVSIISLIIGFFGGIVLTIYKSGSRPPIQTSVQSPSAKKGQGISNDLASRILQLERKTANKCHQVIEHVAINAG